MDSIKALLQSLPKSPGMRIMHFCKEPLLISQIQEYCKSESDYCEYLIATLTAQDATKLQEFQNSYTEVKYLSPQRPRFHMQSKQYDYLFLSTLPQERIPFFKKIYSALKNGAPLFIFLEKEASELYYKIESELIETNYVATNKTELKEFTLLSAKKMHGWSGA